MVMSCYTRSRQHYLYNPLTLTVVLSITGSCMCATLCLTHYELTTHVECFKNTDSTVMSLALRTTIFLVLTNHVRYCSGMATV